MSLFGAMFSGVAGLTAQSSAMGAVSDNISNVSTVGYKNNEVNFSTLVTKQVSSTFYSAGGVQSRPRQRTEVQGLLQASSSQTDIAISGQGFFVVNEARLPTATDQYLFSRAGSFILDDEGYLKNAQGFYLQAWPTDASGNVVSTDTTNIPVPNQNVISSDYLETVNLNRVGGTAAATTTITIGANLPATATVYDSTAASSQLGYQKTDVQFFDTLGTARTLSLQYLKSARDNSWDLDIEPPLGSSVLTLYDNNTNQQVYDSYGLLEFTARPSDGATVVIDGTTYEFDTDGSTSGTNTAVDISSNTSLSQDVSTLLTTLRATDNDFDSTNNRAVISDRSTSILTFHEDGTGSITVDPSGLLDSSGDPVTKQTSSFTVQKQHADYTDATQITFTANPTAGDTITINGTTYTFIAGASAGTNVSQATDLATTLADLETAIEANDAQFSGDRVHLRPNGAVATNNTLVLSSLPSGSYTVDASGLTSAPTEPDGTAFTSTAAITVNTGYAINFDSDGLPSSFNVSEVEITGFTNGAADMDDNAANTPRMTLDFGTAGEATGLTQFGSEFTPGFITQNGSRFGTFAGLTIDTDGLVTALFDNGETRTIYKLPISTFVNPNELEARTGNVWNATQLSGDYTLREADTGSAGEVIQGSLEASTVDLGEEFTKLIVVQRAYSAATKIIRTADEMLEELTRIK